MKKFLINFLVSFIAYLLASAIGLLAWTEVLWGNYGGWLFNFLRVTRDTSHWIFAMIVLISFLLNTGISFVLFFFSGKRLNLFGKHWLNFLSVCGSILIVVIFGALHIEMAFFAAFPFVMLLALIDDVISMGEERISVVLIYIIAVLPSLLTWLGMLYRSKKPNTYKEVSHNVEEN